MWAFPRGEIILGVLEMPGTPQKPKWAANHQISPETGKNCQKQMKPKHFPLIPTMANVIFWKEMKGISQKQKWAAATITKQTQKLATKIKNQ